MTEATTAPFYFDWTFWAALLSLVAIILSQLPPLHILLRPKKLLVEVHSRAHITHKVGNPNIGLFLGISNVGGRTLRIRSLRLRVHRGITDLGSIPAKGYSADLATANTLIFAPFSLKPEESWSHRVNFYNDFERPIEIAFRKSAASLQEEISKLIAQRPEGEKGPVFASDEHITPFIDIFNKLFVWEPGDYSMEIILETTPSTSQRSEMFRFTIYESDCDTLRQEIKDYPTGAGIHFNTDKHAGLSVELQKLSG